MNMFYIPEDEMQFQFPIFRRDCHPVHLTDDTVLSFITGVRVLYNAMTYLFERYDDRSVLNVFKQDIGDYYALRILAALHLIVSQGREERV